MTSRNDGEDDPIHKYILDADAEDLKEILGAAGLDPKAEAEWVERIIRKRLEGGEPK